MKETKKRKGHYLKYRYGIGIEEYEILADSQGNSCAICGEHTLSHTKMLAVDHCHKTGVVRGLLCTKCNVALGLVKEDKVILTNMISYLDFFKENT